MSVSLEWPEIVLRLALTVMSGALLGINRLEHGKPAGLRTMVLVSLAACVAMIQANLLLSTTGKASDSFVNIDPMRLALGILTGMGFIGGGAILRQGNRVQGITTAATLWAATAMGLCFGGGQIGLGLAACALAVCVLTGLGVVESLLAQERRATLTLWTTDHGPSEQQIQAQLLLAQYAVVHWNLIRTVKGEKTRCKLSCEVRWHARMMDTRQPPFLEGLVNHPGVTKVRWVE